MRYEDFVNAYGNHFQDLFSDLMKAKYGSRYQPTCTYGNKGDRGVDGILDYNTAFAVYAPEIYNDNNTINKIESDFNKLMSNKQNNIWNEVKKLIMVIKMNRKGVTSDVINKISELNKVFPIEIITLDDINIMCNGYLPFNNDGFLLTTLKEESTDIIEYCIKTDFTATPFPLETSDVIDELLDNWNTQKRVFQSQELEYLKLDILTKLAELSNYLRPPYMNIINNYSMFYAKKHDINNKLFEIRTNLKDLYAKLNKIK